MSRLKNSIYFLLIGCIMAAFLIPPDNISREGVVKDLLATIKY